jgi:hypothetical protein
MKDILARHLHHKGAPDSAIAQILCATLTDVREWRESHKLEENPDPILKDENGNSEAWVDRHLDITAFVMALNHD